MDFTLFEAMGAVSLVPAPAGLITAAIPEDAREKPIELWWQDEARVGQQGTLTRIWAERGSRPPAPRD